ncbi:2-oxo acid dehydrogenase subunit E2 [Buchnera aphidicola (Chaitoregma tattakana)]|uniref:2-oxo acid dehydrogenase subunit E2 n=1 Tax=Buchnera aphidicola TaxID=9 RepID=UPI0031B882A5
MNQNITEIRAPELPESVTNATIIKWKKNIGDIIKKNENILEIETDKILMSIESPSSGILKKIYKKKGEKIYSKEVLGKINKEVEELNVFIKKKTSPTVRRLLRSKHINNIKIFNRIKKNRITKKDIINNIDKNPKNKNNFVKTSKTHNCKKENKEKKHSYTVIMSNLRKKISERLLETKNNAIMLTTFNEVNMKQIIELREKYKKNFKKKYNINLGFMSFFIKAAVESLKEFPEVNTTTNGETITYYNNYNINIAISTNKGLVAPLIKNTDLLSMQEIEKKILDLKIKSENENLKISEMSSGSFTISNGGVFGSLFSTPIINPPQTAILGINTIQERPIAIKKKIKIMPMIYLSLSYDHRIIDGKSSINFLKHIKNVLEDFSRVIIQI